MSATVFDPETNTYITTKRTIKVRPWSLLEPVVEVEVRPDIDHAQVRELAADLFGRPVTVTDTITTDPRS